MTHKELYKMLERVSSGKFQNAPELLEFLIKTVVDEEELSILGGRIWELSPVDKSYILKFQYGDLKKIPENYKAEIASHPLFAELYRKRTLLSYETDTTLKEAGIELYSMTGVGGITKVGGEKYYQYLLGFNAPDIISPFSEWLSVIGSAVTVALREVEARAAQARIHKDLNKASEIQRSLYPDHRLDFHDYKIFGVCVPDSVVGGDYFDYIKQSDEEDERLSVIVSDAASKGLPAAIQALFVFGAVRMALGFATKMSSILSKLNNLIFETFQYERFVTLFYCELTLSKNRLGLYSNAGHPAPIHYRASTGELSFLEATGSLLGLMENQKFGVENFTMEPGDILALYTDGISEAQNSDEEFFGVEKICDIIKENASESSEIIAYSILEAAQKFNVNSLYTDDKTIVVIKRDSQSAKAN